LLENACPDEIAPSLASIDRDALLARGIRGLLVDVDNTLVCWRQHEIPEANRAWLEQAKQDFAVCLLSNSITFRRLQDLSATLGVPSVARWGWGRKPFAAGYRDALAQIRIAPEQAAMIGDQLLTDVLGANRLGMYTIMVNTLSESEFFATRINRWIEALIRAQLTRRGLWPQTLGCEPSPFPEAGHGR
jgi:HAD superfamily phosphatase (TIGR01668 family)